MLPLHKQNFFRERYKQRRRGWRPSGEELEALVRHHLRPESRVLDLGCGRGGVLELFWREVALPVGADPDYGSLREHRTRQQPPVIPQMPLTCSLAEHLPFHSSQFDLVLAVWVLEHLPQPRTAFREIARVLKPGGHFIFLTPNAWHPLIWANRASQMAPAVQKALVPHLYGRTEADTFRVHYRANTPLWLKQLARESGFTIVSQRAIQDPSYLAFNSLFFEASVLLESFLPPAWGVHLLGEWRKA
jgi:ubiquinone/menaquinone biosynthesis C-methylase UbiE